MMSSDVVRDTIGLHKAERGQNEGFNVVGDTISCDKADRD